MNPCFWCSLWRCGEKKLLVANCLSIFGFDIYDTWKVSNEPPLQFNRQRKNKSNNHFFEAGEVYLWTKAQLLFSQVAKCIQKSRICCRVQGNVSSGQWHPEIKKMMLQKKKTKTLPSELLLGGDAKGANYPNIIINHQRTPRHSDRRYVTTTSRFVLVFILYIWN